MPGLKKTGVKLVAENQQGFLGALNKANKAVSSLGNVGAATGNIGLAALTAGLAAVAFVTAKVIQKILDLTNKIFELGKTSILTAARWDELSLIAQLWGQRAGLTRQEVDDLTRSIVDQGIRTDVANKLIAQMARYQLDLAQATELAAVAQDAATISGQDSSETLDSLLYGTITYNKRVLRTQGILVDVAGGFKRYAKELNKSVEALTEAEKVQATLNEVIKAGVPIAGTYELSMQSAGKQLRTLTGRLLPELSAGFGKFFQPAFLTAVTTASDFVKGLKAMFEEGGKLYSIMVKIGAIADIVADVLKRLSGVALEAGTSFLENLVNKFSETAESALRWGVKITINLADGLIKGASTAIIAAMNFISNLLASWLAPGSPPRIAPDIIKWGKKTMEEYLKGWTLADFSFFDKITGFIASYIRSIPSLIGDKAVNIIPRILGTRKAVAEAIASIQRTGEVTEATINKIVKSIGGATRAFRDYISAYFAAEAATMAVTRAQEELAKASERVKAIQIEINEITSKYDERLKALNKQLGRQGKILDENQRLAKIQTALASGLLTEEERGRLGAEKADIETRQQIRALEDQRDTELATANARLMAAQEEQKAIEARLAPLETQQKAAQELLELQEAIIKTQIDQNNLIKSQMELLKRLADAAKKGGAGDLTDLGAGLAGSFEAATNKINEAIEAAKQRILEKFSEIFAPLRDKWNAEWKPIFEDLIARFEKFKTDLLPIWNYLFDPGTGIVTTTFKKAGDKIAEIWTGTIWPSMKDVFNWISGEFLPFLEGFSEFIRAVWAYDVKLLSAAWEKLKDKVLKPLWSWLSETFGPGIDAFVTDVLGPLKKIVGDILFSFSEWGKALKETAKWLNNLSVPDWLIGHSPSPFEAGIAGVNKAMKQLSQIEIPRLAVSMGNVQHASQAGATSRTVNYNYSTYSPNIQVDPTYTQVQSQGSIYYDVVAALQATRL